MRVYPCTKSSLCIHASDSPDIHECVLIQASLDKTCLCTDRCVCFSLLRDRVEQEAEGKVCISRDKERGCISDSRSVGHSRLTARTGCQVWARCRLMVATLKRGRGLLAAASSAPSSPCVDARSQSSKGNPATLFIFYNCCFWLSPITFSFLIFLLQY